MVPLVGMLLGLFACKGHKPEGAETEQFKSGLTAEDTTRMLELCDVCMQTLKAGGVDDALKSVYVVDSVDGPMPLPSGQLEALRNTFRIFPVVDFKLAGFSFNTSGLNEVKYEIQFFEKEEGDPTPNTIAFMFNPVKYKGKWYLTVKQADQEVLEK